MLVLTMDAKIAAYSGRAKVRAVILWGLPVKGYYGTANPADG